MLALKKNLKLFEISIKRREYCKLISILRKCYSKKHEVDCLGTYLGANVMKVEMPENEQ